MPASPAGQDGPYVIEHGDVWFVETGPSTPGGRTMRLDRRRICGPSENLAMAFDDDNGALLKHGTQSAVAGWLATFADKMSGIGGMAFPMPVMMTFPPNAETVAELNRCIATTGRIKILHDEMTKASKPAIP